METQIYKVQDAQGNVRKLEGPKGATNEEIAAQAEKLFGGASSFSERQLAETGPAKAKAPDGKLYEFPNELQAYNFARNTQGMKPDPTSIAKMVMDYGGKEETAVPTGRRSWGGVAEEAVSNVPQSYVNFVTGIGNAIASPIETVKGIGKVAAGGALNVAPAPLRAEMERVAKSVGISPEAIEGAVSAANEFGGVYKQRYGSVDALKNTIATDPVGAAGDLSMLLGGAGGAVRGGAAVAGTVLPSASLAGGAGRALSAAARYTDPFAPVRYGVGVGGHVLGTMGNIGFRALNPKTNLLIEASEGRADELINALRNSREIVPGSMPTAAQATANTGLVKYQGLGREAERKVLPTEYLTREMEQAAARRNAMGTVAQTPQDLEAARLARSGTAQQLYQGQAFPQVVPSDAGFQKLAERPSMQTAMQVADRLSRERNQPFQIGQNVPAQTVPSTILGPTGAPVGNVTTPAQFAQYPVESLHRVKMALDDMVKDPERFGLGASQAVAIKQTRADFLKWLERRAPDYATARTTYAQQSVPINQMEVGQYLQSKLLSPLDENAPQRAGVFAQAVQDAPGTIKRATGQPRFEKLSDVLTPEQVSVVESIREDLARAQQSRTLGQRGSQGKPKLSEAATTAQEGLRSPNVMVRAAAIANNILERLQGKIDRQLAVQIATEMLNPADAARALEQAARAQAKKELFAAPFRATGAVTMNALASPFLTMGGQMNNLMPSSPNALIQ